LAYIIDVPSPRSVLVIEDEPELRESIEAILEFSDIMVHAARDGKEALVWLAECEDHELPSLILLDLMMPVMSGYEFRYRQLQDDRLADIPTIIVSAGGRGEEDRAMMGCAAYIAKPYGLETLLSAVHSVGASIRSEVRTKCERGKSSHDDR
jgi:CheY-like chemotaxis protein